MAKPLASLMVAASAVTVLSACSFGKSTEPKPTQTATPSPSQPPTLDQLIDAATGMDDDGKMIHESRNRSGVTTIPNLKMKRGEIWLRFACQGSGKVNIAFEPLGRFDGIECDGTNQPTLHQIEMSKSRTMTLEVTPDTDDIRWSIRVSQERQASPSPS